MSCSQKASIHERFRTVAENFGNKVAVVANDASLTYKDLDKRSDKLASLLKDLLGVNSGLIAICVDRTISYPVAVMGALKSSGAFLPLDPKYPSKHLEYMLRDSKAKVLIIEKPFEDLSAQIVPYNCQLILLNEGDIEKNKNNAHELHSPGPDSHNKALAYVIYTSGTTRQPKGVMIGHKSLLNLVDWHIENFQLSPSENVSLYSSFSFDASIWEMFPALLNGNTLYICCDKARLDLDFFNEFLKEYSVAVAFLPTAVCELYLECKTSPLRLLLTGGEKLSKLPDKKAKYTFVNNYGPTENTVVATSCVVTSEGPVSIGKPIQNVSVYILDSAAVPVPDGDLGELYLSGEGLALGYLNNKKLTTERFVWLKIGKNNKIRLYRTGDYVKRMASGEIYFYGRVDDQVKLRGYRIDLYEIESNLLSLPEVLDCAVLLKGSSKNSFLVAHCVMRKQFGNENKEAHSDALKSKLLSLLPEYMVPTVYVFIDKMPLTQNGKKDKKKLLSMHLEKFSDNLYFSPRNEAERTMAAIWSKVLAADRIGIRDNVFQLGATSLSCMQALKELKQQVSCSIVISDLYDNPTVELLAQYCSDHLSETVATKRKAIKPSTSELPLSKIQHQMWFLHKVDSLPRYNIPLAFRLSGSISIDRLKHALQTIIRKHGELRASVVEKNGQILKIINKAEEVELPFEVIDLSSVSSAIDAVNKKMKADANTFFKLISQCLFKCKLFVLEEKKYILYFNFHHIIFDARSWSIFCRELSFFYNNENSSVCAFQLDQLSNASCHDGAISDVNYKESLAYWKKHLSSAKHTLRLETDFLRPTQDSGEGKKCFFSLGPELTNKINMYVKKVEKTMFPVFLTALYLLLRKHADQTSICIGTVLSNRAEFNAEDYIGCFINTVALHIDAEESLVAHELLANIWKLVKNAHKHSVVDFSDVVDAVQPVREDGRSAIFQVMLNMLNTEESTLSLEDAEIQALDVEHNSSVFELSFIVESISDDVNFSIQYRSDLFSEQSIVVMSQQFVNLLDEIVCCDSKKISDLSLVSASEYSKVTRIFNDNSTFYPKDLSVPEIFKQVSEKFPDRVAIKSRNKNIAYKLLDFEAERLAATLRSFCLSPESVIAIFLDKSTEAIISMLGILKASCSYLPLDINSPQYRIDYIINDANVKVIITNSDLEKELRQTIPNEIPIIEIDSIEENAQLEGQKPLPRSHFSATKAVSSNSLAYVIYTSGSTGKPKGVMIEHRSIVRLVKATNYIDVTPQDVFFHVASPAFDAATFEIWAPLLSGAQLIIPDSNELPLHDLASAVKRHDISILFLTSLLFKLLAERYPDYLGSLKVLIAGGEVVDFRDAIDLFLEKNPHAVFVHAYGPTENTTFTTCNKISGSLPNRRLVSIGKPVSNSKVYILDKKLALCPIGVPGILYASGDGLARGYLNNTKLSDKKFGSFLMDIGIDSRLYNTGDRTRWLPDGNVEFLGRNDSQIKIRGFRVELEGIESAINRHNSVSQSIVLLVGKNSDKKIIAYYLLKNESESDVELNDKLRLFLLKTLPRYMIPNRFILIDRIPLTSNGKIDKKLLATRLDISSEEPAICFQPKGLVQSKLLEIWRDVLGVTSISIQDNYFELGGDSIKSLLITDQAKGTGIHFNVQDIFACGNIFNLAQKIESGQIKQRVQLENGGGLHDSLHLSASQRYLFDLKGTSIHQSNIGMLFSVEKKLSFSKLNDAVDKLLDYHATLLLNFKCDSVGAHPFFSDYSKKDVVEKIKLNIASECIVDKIKLVESEICSNFDIENKPLINFCFFESSGREKNFLLITMHHLITDAFSWRILIDDLCALLQNERFQPAEIESGYQFWVEQQYLYAKTDICNSKKYFWQACLSKLAVQDKLLSGEKSKDGPAEFSIKLSNELTASIKSCAKKARAKLDELFIAILCLSYCEWTGRTVVPLLTANNGRACIFQKASIAKTIGLFTDFFPICIDVPLKARNVFFILDAVRDVLRNIPDNGMSFGILAYISKILPVTDAVMPELSFNYMGDFGGRSYGEFLTRIDDISGRSITQELRSEGISIVGMESDQEISFVFGLDGVFLQEKLITDFVKIFEKNVKYTASSFEKSTFYFQAIDSSLFINLNNRYESPSLIFMPGQGGSCLNFSALASNINLPINIGAIQTYGINEGETPFSSIEELAYFNTRILKFHRSTGPYILVGYSYGGTVAFEMASYISRAFGDKVDLILIDAPPHDFKKLKNSKMYLDCAISHLSRSLNLSLPANVIKTHIAALKDENLPAMGDIDAINNFIVDFLKGCGVLLPSGNIVKNVLSMFDYQVNAKYSFYDKSVDSVTICVAADCLDEGDLTTDMPARLSKWQDYVKQPISYFSISGNHFSILEPPNVHKLAKVIENFAKECFEVKTNPEAA